MIKINSKSWLFAAVGIVAFLSAATADVPPEPGFKRISLKLILAPQDEFPDYRFFVKSGADLEEIILKKGEPRTIEPLGGGAWYRAGTFLAVPKRSLAGLSESPSDGKLSEMQKAVYDGRAAGTLELIKHSFAREVRESEASGWKDPVYNIERDDEIGVKAVLVSVDDRQTKAGTGTSFYSREARTGVFWGTVIGGSLLTVAFISLGVWFIRRSRTSMSN